MTWLAEHDKWVWKKAWGWSRSLSLSAEDIYQEIQLAGVLAERKGITTPLHVRAFIQNYLRDLLEAEQAQSRRGREEQLGEHHIDSLSYTPDPDQAVAEEAMTECVRNLPRIMRKIMHLRFGKGHTVRGTGRKLGLTDRKISELEAQALERLRKMMGPIL